MDWKMTCTLPAVPGLTAWKSNSLLEPKAAVPLVISTCCGWTMPLPLLVGSLDLSSEAVNAALAAGLFCSAAMMSLAVVCGGDWKVSEFVRRIVLDRLVAQR